MNELTDKEMWRLCDLAIRRMIDNGIESYDIEDQKLFEKIKAKKIELGELQKEKSK